MTVLKAVLMCLVWMVPVLGVIDYDRVERGVEQQCVQNCPLQVLKWLINAISRRHLFAAN